MIKVLMISVGRMDKGGIESYLMSLLRNTDSRQIHFDYVVHSQDTGCYEKEITERGCRIYKLPRLRSHPFKYLTELMQIMKKGKYDIVHRHATASVMWADLAIAKLAGVKVRIAHSHSSSWNHVMIHKMCRPVLNYVSTARLACSKEAGTWMYGRRKFHIAKNGINIDCFRYNEHIRNEYRKKLDIKGKAVLNTGRLVYEKNQKFIVELAKNFKKINDSIHFYIVGNGPLLPQLQLEICRGGVQDTVHLLGQRNDAAEIMMACDLMILPSKIEGMPIVLVEAQCTGLRCIASESVSHQADFGRCSFIKLDIDSWKKEILCQLQVSADRTQAWAEVQNAGYSEKTTAKKVLEYYKRCLKSTL